MDECLTVEDFEVLVAGSWSRRLSGLDRPDEPDFRHDPDDYWFGLCPRA
jgi:hypothetical protein